MVPEAKTENKKPAETPRAYPINSACQILNLSRSSLYKYASRGQVRFVRVCGRTLVPAAEITRLLGEAS